MSRAMSPGTGAGSGSARPRRLLHQVQDDVVERPAALARQFLDALGDPLVDVAQQEIGHGYSLGERPA